MGAIVGDVAGGITAISIVIARLLFYLRRQLPPAPSAPSGNRYVVISRDNHWHLSAEALGMGFHGAGSAYVCSCGFPLF